MEKVTLPSLFAPCLSERLSSWSKTRSRGLGSLCGGGLPSVWGGAIRVRAFRTFRGAPAQERLSSARVRRPHAGRPRGSGHHVSAMGFWFSKFLQLFGEKEARILVLGLDNAGKTTILYRLQVGEVVSTIPTIGFNVETVQYKNIKFQVWDLGGQTSIRPYWR